MTKLDAALALAAEGFKVFPIKPGAKKPPLLNGWPQKATSDPEEVRSFWLAVPEANVGIHCEGLLVVDVDPKKGGNESLELLKLTEGIPATRTAHTPSGGSHLFYRLPDGHRGVPNSVEELGDGLDIRSTNGYVVAAGSVVPAGAYSFEDAAAEIAPAPDWLVEYLGTVQRADRVVGTAVPAALESTVAAAREWLLTQDPAVEGRGGDAHTYTVACGLRDRGVSQGQALDLMAEDWNDRCSPPWAPNDLAVRVANAYRYATGAPGSKAALPEDFPVVEGEQPGPVKSPTRPALLSLSQFANQERRSAGYVIKGLLQRASYAEAFGAPGEGKTFVALDWSYHVAAGKPWMGRKVHAGPVLYLAFEGVGGLVKRARALRQHYGQADIPLYLVNAAFDLRDKTGRQEFAATLALLPAKPVLIVIDTFARALMGGDENSAQDVGSFNNAVGALIESTGACVCIIHHSGKDKSKGARGSSALLGAIDTEIEIDGGQVAARKQRDVEVGNPVGFKLTPLVVGIDEDGDEETSCVVEPAAAQQGLDRISGNARRGFDALAAKWPDNRPVDPLDWRDACSEFLGERNVAQRFHDLKRTLLIKGYVFVDEQGKITRRMT